MGYIEFTEQFGGVDAKSGLFQKFIQQSKPTVCFSESESTKCLLLVNGYALKPSHELALTDVC